MFSLKSLSISKNKISTKLDASNWDYLNHILMPKRNANVGLLIGCNYPQVLQPLEVNSKSKWWTLCSKNFVRMVGDWSEVFKPAQ